MSGTDLRRYERFGWDYEHFSPLASEEIAWYTGLARVSGGPVLELACGTGRLVAEVAKAGVEVDGIDLSDAMLTIAEERIAALPAEIASRVRLHKADMTDFSLSRNFGLMIIADNSFSVLGTTDMQRACLDCVWRHLRPGGILLVAARRLDFARYRQGYWDSGWSQPISHPITGSRVVRKVTSRLVSGGKRVRTVMLYRSISADGGAQVEEFASETPTMWTTDYIALFRETGFETQVFAGYEGLKDDGESRVVCFVCVRDGEWQDRELSACRPRGDPYR